MPVGVRGRRLLAVLALMAVLTTLAGALTNPPARAQTTPTWSDAGVLELRLVGAASFDGYKCARFPAGSPYTLELFNAEVGLYGICATSGRYQNPDYLWKFELHFAPGTDINGFYSLPLASVRWYKGDSSIPGNYKGSRARVQDSTRFSDQPTSAYVSDEFPIRHTTANTPARERLYSLGSSSVTTMRLALTPSGLSPSSLLSSGTPAAPENVETSRSSDYAEVTLTWQLYDPVSTYEIQRLEATTVTVGDATRIEYGNSETFEVDGTIEGVDSWTDATVDPETTYQYRIRARGGEFSSWSAYVFSGAKERPDLSAPSNLQVARTADNASVAVSWTAPEGEFDNYTLQRQELVVAQGSSFFANTVTFPTTPGTWLPSSSTSYTDSSILPGRIYEYRVAVVKDDLVGDYADWARTTAIETKFGEAPERFRKASEVIRPDRAEYWLEWQEVDGADDYELDLVVFDPTTGRRSLRQGVVVTDPSYFSTAYGRAEYRVRGRKQDTSLCGSGADARCLTPWSGWLSQGFVARQPTVGQPPSLETPPTPEASTLELRAALDAALEESLAPAGLSFDPGGIINFVWLAFGAVVAGLVYDDGRRQGMAPFAFAVAVTFYVIYLWLGVRLVDLPQTWGVMALVVILVGGGVATAKSLGLLGR